MLYGGNFLAAFEFWIFTVIRIIGDQMDVFLIPIQIAVTSIESEVNQRIIQAVVKTVISTWNSESWPFRI